MCKLKHEHDTFKVLVFFSPSALQALHSFKHCIHCKNFTLIPITINTVKQWTDS